MQTVSNSLQNFGRNKTRSSSPPKPRSSSPPQLGGRLLVIVVEAKNLKRKEKNDVVSVVSDVTHQLVGKDFVSQMISEDPFCKVTVGRKTLKTSVKVGTLSPKWNERFIFDSVDPTEVVKFVLRDNLTIGKGHFFGEVTVPISGLKRNQEVDQWHPLCKRKTIQTEVGGSIRVKLLYQPDAHGSMPNLYPQKENGNSQSMGIDYRSPSDNETPTSASPTSDVLTHSPEQQEDDDDSPSDDSVSEPTNIPAQSAMVTAPLNFSASQPVAISGAAHDVPDIKVAARDAVSPPNSSPLLASANSSNGNIKDHANLSPNTESSSAEDDNSPNQTQLHSSQTVSFPIRKSQMQSKHRHTPSVDESSPVVSSAPTSPSAIIKHRRTSMKVAPQTGNNSSSENDLSEYGSRPDAKKLDFFIRKFNLPPEETLLKIFSCALHKQLLLHGRLYISPHYLCFHSNIFGIKTTETIAVSDIIEIKKNFYNLSLGILIVTNTKQYNFASFFSRDKAFKFLNKVWNNSQSTPQGKEEADNEDEEETGNEEEEEDNWEDAFLSGEERQGGFLNSENSELSTVFSEEFQISVLQFFKYFFSDGYFVKLYHEQRGDKDITVKEWSSHPQFGSIRELQYRAPLKQPIGPSSCSCQETQRYHLSKTHLTVETVLVMYDIPYGDYFRVEGRWEVSQGSKENSCKVHVVGGVYFSKKTWWKSKIESGAMKETEESFTMWVQHARKEIAKQQAERAEKEKKSSNSVSDSSAPVPPINVADLVNANKSSSSTQTSPRTKLSISVRNKVVGIITKSKLDSMAFAGALLITFILWIFTSNASVPLLLIIGGLTYRVLSLEKRISVVEVSRTKGST